MNKFKTFYYGHTNAIKNTATVLACVGALVAVCAVIANQNPIVDKEV